MLGFDPSDHLQARGIGLPQQDRINPQLGDKHLHTSMGITDLQQTRYVNCVAVVLNTPIPWTEPQRRRWTKPMTQFEPGDSESNGQRSNQHRHSVFQSSPQRKAASAEHNRSDALSGCDLDVHLVEAALLIK